jgi:hypothetical protein
MHIKRAEKKLNLVFDESGAAAIVFALILVALGGFVALALDIGHIVRTKSELQRTADAAALAGAMGLMPYIDPGGPSQAPNWVNGQNQAHAMISNSANEADNQAFTINDGTVDYGYWSLTPPSGYVQLPLPKVPPPTANEPEPAINVTLSRNVTLYFAPLIGVSSPTTVSATATAILPAAYTDTGVPPVAVAWDTVYNGSGNNVTIDVSEENIKIQANKGVAGWFNLNGGNSVPSVRIDTPLISGITTGTQVYLVPGTKATLTDYMTNGETIVMPIVQDVSQKVWAPIIGWAAFQIDPNGLGSNSITGHFVDQYFDPNVSPCQPTDGTIGAVAGTPKLVGP